jgi:predicted GNAT superfamily acetyltransferase
VDDPSCLFYGEEESVAHLFFDCVVANRVWEMLSVVLGVQVGSDYESIAKMWLCNKKFGICNVFTSAVCWSLWKL